MRLECIALPINYLFSCASASGFSRNVTISGFSEPNSPAVTVLMSIIVWSMLMKIIFLNTFPESCGKGGLSVGMYGKLDGGDDELGEKTRESTNMGRYEKGKEGSVDVLTLSDLWEWCAREM